MNANIKSLLGYGSLRAFVMGYDNRIPSKDEEATLSAMLEEAFDDGLCGLSVGLGYAPDFYADTKELIKAAETVKKHDKIFSFHIRGERMTLVRAIQEVSRIALESGAKIQISHLKCAGKHNLGHMQQILEIIEKSNAAGADITFDVYPYTAGSSYLGLVFPPKYHEGGVDALLERLNDPRQLPNILRDMESGYPGWSTFIGEYNGSNLLITKTASGNFIGKTLVQIAEEMNTSPYEAAVMLMTENLGRVEMTMFQCAQQDVDMAVCHPLSMFGSDSIVMDPEKSRLREMPHPRYYGTFPLLLERYGKGGRMRIETLVHKMTAYPASRFGFKNRGELKIGNFADLCLFDLGKIAGTDDYSAPNRLSVGMDYVFVNGKAVVENGKGTDAQPGEIL